MHYCLHELHIIPSVYAQMSKYEKACVLGSIMARSEAQKKAERERERIKN